MFAGDLCRTAAQDKPIAGTSYAECSGLGAMVSSDPSRAHSVHAFCSSTSGSLVNRRIGAARHPSSLLDFELAPGGLVRPGELQPLSVAGTVLLKPGAACGVLASTAGSRLRVSFVLPHRTTHVAFAGETCTNTGTSG